MKKKIITLLILLIFSFTIFAQISTDSLFVIDKTKAQKTLKYVEYKQK